MLKLRFQNLSFRHRLVVTATTFFLVVASTLAILITIAVRDMTISATAIDDTRAVHAASAAMHALGSRLGAALTDNSVWDDAYKQIGSEGGKQFALATWGQSTDGNPLFDAAVVVTPQHTLLSSYKEGAEFDALAFFGPQLLELVSQAAQSGRQPVVSFIQTSEGPALIAASGIQPFAKIEGANGPFSTLVFAKFLSGEVLKQIEETFGLDDLQITNVPDGKQLNTPLIGADGSILNYLQWPSRNPGAMIYARAYWYLLTAAFVLGTFMIGVLATGAVSIRILQCSA